MFKRNLFVPSNAHFSLPCGSHLFLVIDRRNFDCDRCMSSKELKTLALSSSGSSYTYIMSRKEEIETSMRERLQSMREELSDNLRNPEDTSSTNSSRRRETSNAERNRKRAMHAQAVVSDLCDVVSDLFIAESKLLNPSSYGVVPDQPNSSNQREQLRKNVHAFVSSLPLRYALGVDTPSEVLLHMRLTAAVRSHRFKAAIHIHNVSEDSQWSTHAQSVAQQRRDRALRLVTISCHDADGLLEYISKLLATGGSRVLDADVMLTKDGIVLVSDDALFGSIELAEINDSHSYCFLDRTALWWK